MVYPVYNGVQGAGKTTLIREIVARLGADDTVTSPTFAIVNQYTTREGKNIYHFDFYRINRLEEAYDFGYEEYFYSGDLCLVEWPEKLEELLPEEPELPEELLEEPEEAAGAPGTVISSVLLVTVLPL